ncbi:hypothetical protein [Rhizobium rhizogenes]|nr:hypothetical protein [Rhizobium rhizogenes]
MPAWIKIYDPASDNQIEQIKRWIVSDTIEVTARYPDATVRKHG